MYNEIKLEKTLYKVSGKSLTEVLEELDPSSAYCGTPIGELDAYERQLKRFNIKISGSECDCVEKFFSSFETAILFPEFVLRYIKKGFEETLLPICAVKTISNSNLYSEENTTAITLNEYGRIIGTSYEELRWQKLNVFSIMLKSIGVELANLVTKRAIKILAENADSITTSYLDYNDLAALYGQFDYYNMTTIITYPELASKIAAMDQLSSTSANADGKFILPFGSELIKAPVFDKGKLIGIDRNFALEFITSTDIVVDTDKLINRQLDQITASITCGFRKITPDAVKVLMVTSE